MNSELFQAADVTMPSPRLAWLHRHGIKTQYEPAEICSGLFWWAWRMKDGDPMNNNDDWVRMEAEHTLGSAETEDGAIFQLAINLGIKLWNEEQI